MSTLLITHPACLQHLVPQGHPERPDRLRAVERAREAEKFQALARVAVARFFAENFAVQAGALERTVVECAEGVMGADAALA